MDAAVNARVKRGAVTVLRFLDHLQITLVQLQDNEFDHQLPGGSAGLFLVAAAPRHGKIDPVDFNIKVTDNSRGQGAVQSSRKQPDGFYRFRCLKCIARGINHADMLTFQCYKNIIYMRSLDKSYPIFADY